jgi:hypothetical protein
MIHEKPIPRVGVHRILRLTAAICSLFLLILVTTVDANPLGASFFGIPNAYGSNLTVSEDTLSGGNLKARGGFLIHNRGLGVGHGLDAKENPVFNLVSILHNYSHQGFWLGIAKKVSVCNAFDVEVEGAYLFHTYNTADSRYQSDLSAQMSGRRWNSESTPSTWYIDGVVLWNYSPWLRKAGWSMVNGFRYDHYHRKFKDPGPLRAFAALPGGSSPNDTLDIQAHSFIPYIGMQKESVYSHGSFTIGSFIGIVFGNLHHEETWGGGIRIDEASATYTATRSWWFEALVEWNHNITKDLAGGLYMQWGGFHTYGDASLRSTLAGASQSGGYDFSFLKLSYFTGAQLSIKFASLL